MSGADLYVLAVYIESQRSGTPVRSGVVAEQLDKSPPSITEMLQRLDEQGLVVYKPYEGATPTTSGHDRAAELHESYVTLWWFFRSVLEPEYTRIGGDRAGRGDRPERGRPTHDRAAG
jgi:DtxR family Mn-dependent transcriptional regulator